MSCTHGLRYSNFWITYFHECLTYLMGVIPPYMSWVIIHHTKICVSVKVCPLSWQKGNRAEPPKVRTGQKQEVSAFYFHLLLDLCSFLRMGVSRDAEHYGEVQNAVTSWFARQKGSASIFLPVIDRFMPFSQDGGFPGIRSQWWMLNVETEQTNHRVNIFLKSCRLLSSNTIAWDPSWKTIIYVI